MQGIEHFMIGHRIHLGRRVSVYSVIRNGDLSKKKHLACAKWKKIWQFINSTGKLYTWEIRFTTLRTFKACIIIICPGLWPCNLSVFTAVNHIEFDVIANPQYHINKTERHTFRNKIKWNNSNSPRNICTYYHLSHILFSQSWN